MSCLTHHLLTSRNELLNNAPSWNALWQRSHARQPTVRAKGIDLWIERFARDRDFVAVCVEENGQLVAAMPLVRDKIAGVFPRFRLPVNCWANAGDLLVDRGYDLAAAVDCLVDGMEALGGDFALEEIAIDAPQWTAFQQAVWQRKGRSFCRGRSSVGVADILHDWNAYEKSWSGNHRSAVKRSYRKLEKQGDVSVERHQRPGAELNQLLTRAFEIENRSWKGDAGSSVLKSPGMLDYMLSEAQAIAEAGHLDLWFLKLDEKPIAFEYCHVAKGVCFSHKIGYEAEYARFGPGRLLRFLQLKQYHSDPNCNEFDMLGTLCDSKAKWATRTYDVGNLLVAVGNTWRRRAVSAYANIIPKLRALRGTKDPIVPKLGAAEVYEKAKSSPAPQHQLAP